MTVTSPDVKEAVAAIDAKLTDLSTKVDALLREKEAAESPWLRGDEAAAKFAGYRSRRAFLRWARENGVKPSKDDQINFWDKAAIVKARKRRMS